MMLFKERIIPGADLFKLVGDTVTLDLDGKLESLPLAFGFFKITGTRKNKKGTFIVGYDDEMLRWVIPVERIDSYIRRK